VPNKSTSANRGWNDFLPRKIRVDGEPLSFDRGPFVLLDDGRGNGAAFILKDPVDVIVASSVAEVVPALEAA